MELIDGKLVSSKIKLEISAEVEQYKKMGYRSPGLAAVLVGHDGGSETYVAAKMKSCGECGFNSTLIRFEDTVSQQELLEAVEKLNNDDTIDGYIVQLPLPKHIDEQVVINSINPDKDVDGFTPVSVGLMTLGLPSFISATPKGILELLKHYNIETDGKNCVVIGRSNIVGKPLAILMMQKNYPGNCTVTVCHSASHDLKEITSKADILVAALGRPKFVKADMVKDGAVVIDVGTTRVPDVSRKSGFRLSGDVDFDEVAPKCSHITPVPGGVGPMTIASLMSNTLSAYKKRFSL